MKERQGRFGPLALLCVAALVGGGCLGSSVVGGPAEDGGADGGARDASRDGAFDAPDSADVTADATDAGTAGDGATADAGGADAAPMCTSNAGCADNEFGQNTCDLTTGRCVRCTMTADTCAAGEYCNPTSNTCVRGCRNDDACRGSAADGGVADGGDGGFVSGGRCNPTTRTCVDCVTDDQCATGQRCVGSVWMSETSTSANPRFW